MDKHNECINTHIQMVKQEEQIKRLEHLMEECADSIGSYTSYLSTNRDLDLVNYIDVLAAISGLRTRQTIFIQAIQEIRDEGSES